MIDRGPLFIESGPPGIALFHSDRPKQLIREKCRLCFQEDFLKLSHIAPKWSAQWMKSEGRLIHNIQSEGVVGRSNDIEKHYLLCGSCEQLLGKSERYLSCICKGDERNLNSIGVKLTKGPYLKDFKYDEILGAILGIFYKAHFVSSYPWVHLTLPHFIMERINRFLLHRDRRAIENFYFTAIRRVAFREASINPKAALEFAPIIKPRMICIDILLGGWSWIVFMPSDEEEFTEQTVAEELNDAEGLFPGLLVRRDRDWQVMQAEITEGLKLIRSIGLELDDDYEIAHFDSIDHCYCGMTNLKFSECCMNRWIRLRDGRLDLYHLARD